MKTLCTFFLVIFFFSCKKDKSPAPDTSFIEFYYNDTLVHFGNSAVVAYHDTSLGRKIYVFKATKNLEEFVISIVGDTLTDNYEFTQSSLSYNSFSYSDSRSVNITSTPDSAFINMHIQNFSNKIVNATFSGFTTEYFSKRPMYITGGKIKEIKLSY